MPTVTKSAAEKSAKSAGIVLKAAFPQYDAEQLKTLRRYLRKALRKQLPDQKAAQFTFHKIGSRWVFPKAADVTRARELAKEVLQ